MFASWTKTGDTAIKAIWISAVLACSAILPVRAQELPAEVVAYPETILFNGKILTVDSRFSVAQALAIRADRILAVGDTARILRMAGPATRRIDLGGKTVVPGLIDTHYHQGGYAISRMLLDEKGIRWEGKVEWMGLLWDDVEMALRDVRRAVEAAAPGELIRIPYFLKDKILPKMTMAQLDAVSPNNPVVFVHITSADPRAGNSKAIEAAGIPPGTPGLPSGGVVLTGQANQMFTDYFTWSVPLDRLIPAHQQSMQLVNRWGLTTVVTRITPIEFNAVREMWLKDQLTLRWRVAFPGPVDVPRTGNLSDIGDDWLRISGTEINPVPGYEMPVGPNHWSSQVRPASPEEETSVRRRWTALRAVLLEYLKYGWSIPNTHVVGDIAVREFLNAIEEARLNPIARSSNQRLTMDHMVEVAESDIRRMQLLGLQPSNLMKDVFAESVIGSPAYESVFGLEYVHRMLPLKKYVEAGMRPTLEADTGEDQKGEPLWSIEKAVCRCVEGTNKVWGRDQKVSREDALRMKTVWAAAFTGDEKKLGSMEPGKLADLVVLDGDYLTVAEDQIAELPVFLTIVGGKIAYSAED